MSTHFSPQQTLILTRIIWAALLAGTLVIAVVLATAFGFEAKPPTDPNTEQAADFTIWLTGLIVTLTAIPAGLFIRGQAYKKGWTNNTVSPRAYHSGNIIAFATCEGTAIVNLIFYFVVDHHIANLICAVVSIAVLAFLFPNGKAMFPPDDNTNPYAQP